MSNQNLAVKAQAEMHHAFLLGLQLMVSVNKDAEVVGDWMFRLFRRQHLDKFLSSFSKLGLDGLPDAVACAQYHVMSNSVGGVPVEYMYESDQKAWVRFRYPRWMYHGPTICGVPVSVSRGFLKGWYAYNGVSLKNPRLGYVCVSEDMTGEFGLCGYFKEYDHDLGDEERLQFAKGEQPPEFNVAEQPSLPSDQWSEERLEKANRNYAMDYIRNGLVTLADVIGDEETMALASRAARLIGLQYMSQTRQTLGIDDGTLEDAAEYLTQMFGGLGDVTQSSRNGESIQLTQQGLRIVRDLEGRERRLILSVWVELWKGTMNAFQQIKDAEPTIRTNEVVWKLANR